MEKRAVIETIDLSIGYLLKKKERNVVHEHLNISLYAGEVTSLLGLNGAGKSTLLRTLCGFQPPLAGNVRFMGKPVEEYSQAEFSLCAGVVLTEKTNAGGLTVKELVALGRHPYTGFFGKLKPIDIEIVEESMEAVGIAHKASHYVSELSDGERQKAMIAKTLAQQCPVIILDEPTAFLDVTSRIEIMMLLHRLASSSQNKAILLSTHDIDLSLQLSDSLWLLAKNKGMMSGSPEDLILDGALDHFFDRNDIHFDAAKGKFITSLSEKEVYITGDEKTKLWVANAVTRNGFNPSSQAQLYPRINCVDAHTIIISFIDGNSMKCSSVREMIEVLKKSDYAC